MDCRDFRKQHFAYLDDTLPGDTMVVAQQHIMKCDSCAAHDSMVRRSLMLVRNVPVIQPSADFRNRMQARLAEVRTEQRLELADRPRDTPTRPAFRPPVVFSVVVLGVLVAGTMVWHGRTTAAQIVAIQPAPTISAVTTTPIDTTSPAIYVSPAMLQAMAIGNPMWSAALIVDDAPAQLLNSGFRQVRATR